jgi:hypothetical protein
MNNILGVVDLQENVVHAGSHCDIPRFTFLITHVTLTSTFSLLLRRAFSTLNSLQATRSSGVACRSLTA